MEIDKIVFGIIGFIALVLLLSQMFGGIVFKIVGTLLWPFFLLTLFLVGFFFTFIKTYGETERAIIYRFGKFNRVAGPGWSIVIPFIEQEFKKIDIRTRSKTLENVQVFSKDDIPLYTNVAIFYGIVDPKKAVLQVTVLEDVLFNYFIGAIRNGMSNFAMREIFSKLDEISTGLEKNVVFALQQWGVNIISIQIQNIKLPEDVLNALIKPLTSEQEALATRFQAEAKRVLIEVLGDAAERLNPNAISYLYLKALEKIGTAPNSKILLPANFSSVANTLSAGISAGLGLGEGLDIQKIIDQIAEKIKGK
ncbi:MAG: SPFH domain-containing protein [Candidatus Aenigmarchaeota archaeon]|nr:SPFH domain-containing protein [Candidatus Aenigmarchaeota archaeon]MDW8149758.1 SPFH domain-containing protein [Candidatus Aenigmarchaeota archaeon]